MEQREVLRSLRERVGMTVLPADPATLVATLVEIEKAGVDHVWVSFAAQEGMRLAGLIGRL